jgi:hypothetical protein
MKKDVPQKKHLSSVLVFAAVLVAALAIRIIFLVQLERSELGNALALDSRFYYDLARSLSSGGSLGAGALDFNPFYPAFLLIVFRLFGEGLLVPRIVQLVFGLLTVALMFLGGSRLVEGPRRGKPPGELTAILAAAMTVLYAQFILYEGMLLSTAFEVFLVAASFVLALALDGDLRGERPLRLCARRVPPWISGLFLGALCGLGSLARPNLFLLVIAALPPWLYMRNRRKRRGLLPAMSFIAGAALFLAPPIAYNAKAAGRFVPVTAHGGINFYMGNRSGGSGIFQALEGVPGDARGSLEESRARAEAETGRRMTTAEASDYYVRRTIEDISLAPGAWLRLVGRKLLYFFNGVELYDVPNVYFCEQSCGVLKLLLLPFAVIAPLAICGLIVLWRSGRNRSVVSIFLGCAFVSVLLFFVNARYRLPAVPILILLAAFFIAWAARELSRRRVKNVAIMTAAAVALFFLVSHRGFVAMNHSAAYAFLGTYYIENNNEKRAEEAFAEAYRRDPKKIEAILNYAKILGQRGKYPESAEMFGRAYERMPHFPEVTIGYGRALERLGRLEEAKRLYRDAASSSRPQERDLARRLLERLEGAR